MADRDSSQAARDLDKVRRHVRILADLSRLSVARDEREFLERAVVQVARAVEIDHVKVLQYRRKTSDLIITAGVGWKEGVVGSATLSADFRSPPGRAYQTGEPISIFDLRDQSDYDYSSFLKDHGIVSLLNVPVLIDGAAAWGVLEVDSATPRDFTQDTLEFMTAAGALIGAVVERLGEGASEAKMAADAALKAQQRGVLLREMQHRVKNNFQTILASIAQQKRRFPAGQAAEALDRITARIHAISLAHDQLAPRAGGGEVVELASYLRALCLALEHLAEPVEISLEADEVELGIDRASALGLVLNELVTNSIKHAFGDEGGIVRVRLESGIGYGEARLTVADNGCGMTKARGSGSGLELVTSLTRQVSGVLEQETSKAGTTITLTFPTIA